MGKPCSGRGRGIKLMECGLDNEWVLECDVDCVGNVDKEPGIDSVDRGMVGMVPDRVGESTSGRGGESTSGRGDEYDLDVRH